MCLFEFLSEFAWAIFPTFPWWLSKNIQATRFSLAENKTKQQKKVNFKVTFGGLFSTTDTCSAKISWHCLKTDWWRFWWIMNCDFFLFAFWFWLNSSSSWVILCNHETWKLIFPRSEMMSLCSWVCWNADVCSLAFLQVLVLVQFGPKLDDIIISPQISLWTGNPRAKL